MAVLFIALLSRQAYYGCHVNGCPVRPWLFYHSFPVMNFLFVALLSRQAYYGCRVFGPVPCTHIKGFPKAAWVNNFSQNNYS
jgi:hypothetical protein